LPETPEQERKHIAHQANSIGCSAGVISAAMAIVALAGALWFANYVAQQVLPW
jgi:hypothetical protein